MFFSQNGAIFIYALKEKKKKNWWNSFIICMPSFSISMVSKLWILVIQEGWKHGVAVTYERRGAILLSYGLTYCSNVGVALHYYGFWKLPLPWNISPQTSINLWICNNALINQNLKASTLQKNWTLNSCINLCLKVCLQWGCQRWILISFLEMLFNKVLFANQSHSS